MTNTMYQISAHVDADGGLLLTQFTPEKPDSSEVRISRDQAPTVARWILDAALDEQAVGDEESDSREIPVNFWNEGPFGVPETMTTYASSQGMVILHIAENQFLEISPAMAKRLRANLDLVIRHALNEMMRPDAAT